jgi:hypothetical protein
MSRAVIVANSGTGAMDTVSSAQSESAVISPAHSMVCSLEAASQAKEYSGLSPETRQFSYLT